MCRIDQPIEYFIGFEHVEAHGIAIHIFEVRIPISLFVPIDMIANNYEHPMHQMG